MAKVNGTTVYWDDLNIALFTAGHYIGNIISGVIYLSLNLLQTASEQMTMASKFTR